MVIHHYFDSSTKHNITGVMRKMGFHIKSPARLTFFNESDQNTLLQVSETEFCKYKNWTSSTLNIQKHNYVYHRPTCRNAFLDFCLFGTTKVHFFFLATMSYNPFQLENKRWAVKCFLHGLSINWTNFI